MAGPEDQLPDIPLADELGSARRREGAIDEGATPVGGEGINPIGRNGPRGENAAQRSTDDIHSARSQRLPVSLTGACRPEKWRLARRSEKRTCHVFCPIDRSINNRASIDCTCARHAIIYW
jgi:hypothetical protein